jgi:peptidoglycan hydrolase FlgJ
MRVEQSNIGAQGLPSPAQKRAQTPVEAARQFEEILAKQFVKSMTDGLFKTSLAGDDAPGWMGAYGDMQKDVLADELAKHLVDSGTLRISEMLLRQWDRASAVQNDDGKEPPSDLPDNADTAAQLKDIRRQ